MAERERPPYLPELPFLNTTIADFVPPAPADAAAELVAPATTELPTPPPSPATAETQHRVTLSGRVGRKPIVWTTQKGILRAKFPLGVHGDGDTTWYTIQAFRRQAEVVRDTVQVGDALEVIGYRQAGQKCDINATVIKRR